MATDSPTSKLPSMAPGQRYGRLVVVEFVDYGQQAGRRRPRWRCRCDCGKEVVATAENMRSGNTKSCGCYRRETIAATGRSTATHGQSRSREYGIWNGMLDRCRNENSKDYPRYGGRGIKVCERWLKFENFLSDMGLRPSPAHSIDRYPDKNGNYEPGNVRWASDKTQARNRRSNHIVKIFGKEMTLIEACEFAGLNYSAVKERLRLGWSERRSFNLED